MFMFFLLFRVMFAVFPCFNLALCFWYPFLWSKIPHEHEKYPFTFHYTGCLIGALTMAYYNPHITVFLIPYIYPKQPGFCSLLIKLASTVTPVTAFECWFYKANLSCGEPDIWVHWYVY